MAIGAKGTTFKDFVVYATYYQGSRKAEGKEGQKPTGSAIYFIVAESIVLLYLFHRNKIAAIVALALLISLLTVDWPTFNSCTISVSVIDSARLG